MNNNDGGPAFPFPVLHGNGAPTGMSLRDYFAAKAMQSLIYQCGYTPHDAHEAATNAYHIADAMLGARGL